MKNNCNNNYELFNKGLGEICKSEYINWISNEGSGGIGLTNNLYSKNNNKIGEEIEIVTIDSLNLDKLDYIKIDVEGYEENIINGSINTINKYKPIIILECYKSFEPLIEGDLDFVKNKYKLLLDIGYNVEHIWKADFLFTYSHNSENNLLDNHDICEVEYTEELKKNIKLNILPEISINKNIPTALIIDNFYNNVDEVRNYALSLDYESEENHGAVGFRCESGSKKYNGTKEYFEYLLNVKIQDNNKEGGWNYSTNGCFQWCPNGTRLVYHCDSQNYAGIIYLTPDAPVKCGTSLLRHKKHKIKDNKIFELDDWHELIENKDNLFTDKISWEEVDNFGNIYNRLVLFNSHNVHAVTEYFGDNINNSRLFQLFFFNVKSV